MVFSPACFLPSRQSIGFPGLWSSVLASPYSTSAFLYSPSPLKMDDRSVKQREWRRKHAEAHRKSDARWQQENRAMKREYNRNLYKKTSVYHKYNAFLSEFDWPLQHLTWTTHIPVKSEKKAKRACASCGRYEYQGLRLWWQRRDVEPPLYDCFSCFRTSNPEHVVPIGYEGLDLLDALKAMREARKQHDKAARKAATLPSGSDKPH